MSKKIFTTEEIKILKSNPNVATVTRRAIQYTDEFKIKALEEYNGGKSVKKIFNENGLSVDILGISRMRGFIQRISKETKKEEETPQKHDSYEQQIKKLERRITYLQQENEFLKKIQKLERKK